LTETTIRHIFDADKRFHAGEAGRKAGAEGATAPETLRQKNRAKFLKLWKAAPRFSQAPTEGRNSRREESLR
jgi:hypothetical protein